MERATRKQREEFIETLLSHIPDRVQATVNTDNIGTAEMVGTGRNWSWFHDGRPFAKRLMRYGATLGRLAEQECNGYQDWQGNWDQKAADRAEKKERRIKQKVMELCCEWGCAAVFQGDPRGNVLKIRVPDGYTNDWGREGICVPTS